MATTKRTTKTSGRGRKASTAVIEEAAVVNKVVMDESIDETVDETEEIAEGVPFEDEEDEEDEEEVVVVKKRKKKEFAPTDKVLCHSIFSGKLFYTGTLSKLTYEFANYGARAYVQYQDLEHGLFDRKSSIITPYIIIDDEDVLDIDMWQEVKDKYKELYNMGDLKALLKIGNMNTFKKEFNALTIEAQRIVADLVATQIENGTFESVNKAKYIDEVCKTDLMKMME